MNVLILTGSARPNSAGKNVAAFVEKMLAKREDVTPEVVEVSELNLPFFDAELPPSAEGFEIPHDSVKSWSEKVQASDAVVFVSPEYNGSLSGVQKNAIDWLLKEWQEKPVAIVAYGWHAGARVLKAYEPITGTVGADVRAKKGLQFGELIQADGTVEDEEKLEGELAEVFDAITR